MNISSLPSPEIDGYSSLLAALKERIRAARFRSVLAVNRELIALYWEIGRDVLARQAHDGWGAKTIDRLADDLSAGFLRDDGPIGTKPQIHASFRGGLS